MQMRLLVIAAISLVTALPASGAEPRNEAAVVAADDSWLKAEVSGNGDYLDGLLLPGYMSVGAGGKITSKAQIVAKARARTRQELVQLAEQVATWKAAHPVHPDVTIAGDTAILRWVATQSDGTASVSSSDMFLYRDGRWRAIYSQHTSAAN
jgi:hypothetical protein